MKKSAAVTLVLILGGILSAVNPITSGLEAYARSDWSSAILSFRKAISSDSTVSEPWYWLILSEISAAQYDTALIDIERFINGFSDDQRIPDILYQKGRIYYLTGKYDESIQVLYQFLSGWPEHQLIASAYYWIGESLYSVGRFDESASIFRIILDRYPDAVKREAAIYRIALIEQGKQEEELLKLLKMSHEESLKIIEEYQRREKTYEQAINAYQKRISDMMKDTRLGELEKQLGDEKVKNTNLLDRISVLEIQNAELAAALSISGGTVPETAIDPKSAADLNSSNPETRNRALEDLRRKAETLKQQYQQIEEVSR